MKKTPLFVIFVLCSTACFAQETETRYSRSRNFDEQVPADKAKFSRTITRENGITTITEKNLKKNEVVYTTAYRGDEPVGLWTGASGTDERDFDFELKYAEKHCTNPAPFSDQANFFADNSAIGYQAPVIAGDRPTLMPFLVSNLRYPAKARTEGISGSVFMAFTITKDGIIEDIVVTEGVHIVLDKEAVRLIRKIKLSSPPKLNGEPVEVCVAMPVKFALR